MTSSEAANKLKDMLQLRGVQGATTGGGTVPTTENVDLAGPCVSLSPKDGPQIYHPVNEISRNSVTCRRITLDLFRTNLPRGKQRAIRLLMYSWIIM